MICPLIFALALSAPKFDLHGDPLPVGAVARIGTERLRQPYDAHLRFSEDGKLLASADWDRIRLWRVADGKLLANYACGQGCDGLGPIANDGTVLIASGTETIRFDPEGRPTKRWKHRYWPIPSAINADGSPAVQLRKSDTGEYIVLLPDPKGGKDREITLNNYEWPLQDRAAASTITVSPDQKSLVFGSSDKHPTLVDLTTGRSRLLHRRFRTRLPRDPLTYTPDGILMGTDDLLLCLLKPDGKDELLTRRFTHPLEAVAASPDGKTIAVTETDGIIRLLNRADLSDRPPGSVGSQPIGMTSFNWTPDSRNVVTSSSGGRVIVWGRDGRLVRELPSVPVGSFGVQASPDGERLIASGFDHRIYMADLVKGQWSRGPPGSFRHATSPIFSPDSSRFLYDSSAEIVQLWDVVDRKVVGQFGTSNPLSRCAGFSSMGWVATFQADGKVTVWDAESGVRIGSRQMRTGGLTFSPDGSWLAGCGGSSGGWGPVMIWEPRSGASRGAFVLSPEKHRFGHPCFTADGQYLIVAAEDVSIRVLELPDGREVRRFDGDAGHILGLSVSPDGRWLVSAHENATGLVWNLNWLKRSKVFTDFELWTAWVSLMSHNPRSVYEAMIRLESSRNRAVDLIAENAISDAKKAERSAREELRLLRTKSILRRIDTPEARKVSERLVIP